MRDEDFDQLADERPSKSSLKREAQAKRELGDCLVELNARALSRLPLSPEVRKAISDAQAISAHGARRRQLQYLAKLLRGEDAEAISAALERLLNPAGTPQPSMTPTADESPWLNRLLQGDDGDIEALLAESPSADRTRLRQLVRNARRPEPQSATRGLRQLRAYLDSLSEAH